MNKFCRFYGYRVVIILTFGLCCKYLYQSRWATNKKAQFDHTSYVSKSVRPSTSQQTSLTIKFQNGCFQFPRLKKFYSSPSEYITAFDNPFGISELNFMPREMETFRENIVGQRSLLWRQIQLLAKNKKNAIFYGVDDQLNRGDQALAYGSYILMTGKIRQCAPDAEP